MTETAQTYHVKLLLNDSEPEAIEIAEAMRAAGVRFSILPTLGPLTIIVDGYASYGLAGLRHVAAWLILSAVSDHWDSYGGG